MKSLTNINHRKLLGVYPSSHNHGSGKWGLEDDFSLQGGHFPLRWLWEEGNIMKFLLFFLFLHETSTDKSPINSKFFCSLYTNFTTAIHEQLSIWLIGKPIGKWYDSPQHQTFQVYKGGGMWIPRESMYDIPSLELTVGTWKWAFCPKRKGSYSNHPFSGAFAVSFRGCNEVPSFINPLARVATRSTKIWKGHRGHRSMEIGSSQFSNVF